MKSDPRVVHRCHAIASASAVFVVISGCLALCGWIFGVEFLKALVSPRVTMKANTSVCLILAGSSLWLLTRRTTPWSARRAGHAMALLLLLLAAATLGEHLTRWNLGIDQFLFNEPSGAAGTASPGRMGPPASTALALSALALLTLDWRTRRDRVLSQYFAIAISLIAMLSLIGYAYGIRSLYILPRWTGIAAHTSLALMVLAVGLFCAQPEHGLMAVITSEGAGGMLMRRMLLPALIVPFALGWLRTFAQRHGVVEEAVGRPAFILSMIIILTSLIWWNARSLAQIDSERTRVDAERRAAEAEMRASEARFRRVSECGMIGIVFGDIYGNIFDANDAFLQIIGVSSDDVRSGKVRWSDLTPPEQLRLDEKAILEMMHCGIAVPYEKEYVRKDGVRVPVLLGAAFLEGSRTQTVAFVLDLSLRRRMEELARQQHDAIAHLSRVTTVGEMAAGLAHELNQPLGAILNYAGVALETTLGSEQTPALVTEALEHITAESKRAGDIVRRLRDFVRKQRPEIAPVQVNPLIRDAVGLLAAELRGAGVQWELELAENLPSAMADGVQIEQVLVNLLRNAAEAMVDVQRSDRRLVIRSTAPDAATVRVQVIDRGCGGDQQVLDSMFNAFFTTKPDGMGMGLAISRSIIEAHSGHVRAIANPQSGLTVEFSLPVASCEGLP